MPLNFDHFIAPEEDLGKFKPEMWPFEDIMPREVQLEALAKGYARHGFAYFMRQRLGKTWVALAEYKILHDQGFADWMVVICPNSIKDQWFDAIIEADPTIPTHIYRASKKKDAFKYLQIRKSGVFIINYDSVDAFIDYMNEKEWEGMDTYKTYIVADESTEIKDPRNVSTKACVEFADMCRFKRVLTGKPQANSQADLWTQLRFITATQRNFFQHKATFVEMGGYKGKQIKTNVNTELLKREMEPYCYIAPDKYVKGFEKIYEPLRFIQMSTKQQELYDQMEQELLLELEEGVNITAPIALTKYLRLQQISSGIAGDEFGAQHNLIDPSKNPRIKAIRSLIENEISNKVIIICRFVLSIDNLEKELTKDGHKCVVLKGGLKPQEFEARKKAFTEGDANVLIAQIQVLQYGHTLCGPDDNPCTDMIFFENNFSLIDRAQCESRPEKYGRDKPISYWDFFCSEMDKYIMQALIKKEDFSVALMGYARTLGILPNANLEPTKGLSEEARRLLLINMEIDPDANL